MAVAKVSKANNTKTLNKTKVTQSQSIKTEDTQTESILTEVTPTYPYEEYAAKQPGRPLGRKAPS